MLQAAARIADGEVPYRDFWWFYPPGQPYLLAGLLGAVRPVAADLADRARARRRHGRRCSSTCSRGARRRAAAWRWPPGWPRSSRWPTRAGRIRSRSRWRSRSARCCCSSAARRWRACWSARARPGGSSSPPTSPGWRSLLARAGRAPRRALALRARRAAWPRAAVRPGGARRGPRALVGPARRLPADGLQRLPGAAVPALLRRPAEHRLARRLLRTASSRCSRSTCRSRS